MLCKKMIMYIQKKKVMKEAVKIEKEPEDNAASAYSVTAESYSKMR